MSTRKLLLLVLIIFSCYTANAQSKLTPYFSFKFVKTDPVSLTKQAVYIGIPADRVGENYISDPMQWNNAKPWSPILLGVKINPYLKNYFSAGMYSLSRLYTSYIISDSSEVELIAMGINTENVKDYKYRVIENDSAEIVPWSPVPLSKKYYAKVPFAFFGNFRALGKQLIIEIQHINNYNIRDGVVLDWRTNFRPVVNEIKVQLPFSETQRNYYFNLKNTKRNKGYATKFLPGTEIPEDFRFPVDSVAYMNFTFKHHETIPYVISVVYKEGKGDTSYVGSDIVSETFTLDSKNFARVGKYEVVMERPLMYPDSTQKLHIPFEVLPAPFGAKITIKQLLPYLLATFGVVAFLFFLYRRQNRAKLQRMAQQKEVVGLKLQSIRAQLNPHFMFNALTSIQNLINKNNISGANYYLSKFAVLTRHVLDSSTEEMISLEDEIKILNDYLQMEQLRFNFKYDIKVSDNIDSPNIEIPAMLLQPFVENAIKHGIAGLNEDGYVAVIISADGDNLLLSVSDNGKGFVRVAKAGGYGIKLSEDRVALLNQIYKDQTVHLNINDTPQGTTIRIRLTNWI